MKVLIVVDMQNDFIDGSLGTKEAVSVTPEKNDRCKRYDGNCQRRNERDGNRGFVSIFKVNKYSIFIVLRLSGDIMHWIAVFLICDLFVI